MRNHFTLPVYPEDVPTPLPRLRMDLEFMPSPLEDRPGLMIRDPYQYSGSTVVIPPPLVPLLACFDGEQTDLDLRQLLVRLTGDLRVSEIQDQFLGALESAGFLHGERLEELRQARHAEFAAAQTREAAHAGRAYPDDPSDLNALLAEKLSGSPAPPLVDNLLGVAAPHISPDGGWDSYRDAYRALPSSYADRTFVVLGTSHFGEPDKFGLTRKPFDTPFGSTRPAVDLISRLENSAPRAVRMEDYCHSMEHSIEFQIVFLQSIFGPEISILPILCGPFAKSLYGGGMPEDDDDVRTFLNALGDLEAAEAGRLCWVLGIDMAHMGRRYGDPEPATAHEGLMIEVAERDSRRIQAVEAGDARAFWELIRPNHDDLKWCGSAPLYTFLFSHPGVRGRLRRYQQWNIDEASVVSFGAIAFHPVE